ncbi:MAG: hypothetical protein IV085_09825 [Thiobacillus sp.]|nr:hypothetical protein [Thiobacillus sp.]
MKNMMFVLLASAGLSLAHVAHAAEAGIGAGADVQLGGSAGAAGPGADARLDSAADAQLGADGSVKQPLPMTHDSTRGMEGAHERMSPAGTEPEQAMGKKESDKKTAKQKRDKKPAREEQ